MSSLLVVTIAVAAHAFAVASATPSAAIAVSARDGAIGAPHPSAEPPDPVDDRGATTPLPTAPTTFGSPKTPAHPQSNGVRVAVLPIVSADGALTAAEAALVTQLMSIRVERGGFDVVIARDCAAPECLAEVASATGADGVMLGTHGVLGGADVVTMHVWDAAQSRMHRDAVTSADRAHLADSLGGVVDALLARMQKGLPALRQPTIKQRFEQTRVAVRDGEEGWWFVEGSGRAITENEFVRRYRAETHRRNLDDAEIDREPDYFAWTLTAMGVTTGIASLGLTIYFAATPEGQALANASDDAWVIIPALGLSTALGLTVYGAIELADGATVDDGSELDHALSVEQARMAAQAYNDALLERLSRDPAQP